MNQDMTNSKLLSHLFECAEKIKNNNGSKILTVNHVFAAVLEYCNNTSESQVNSEYDVSEVKALFEIVNDITKSEKLSSYIEMLCSKKETYIDDLLFRQVMASSKQISEQKGKKNITADIFLKCIIDSPTDEIKTIMSGSDKKDKNSNITSDAVSKAAEEFLKFIQKDKDEEKDGANGEALSEETEAECRDCGMNPKEQIAALTEKVKSMQRKLSSVVFGQDNAISIFASGYFQSELRSITDKTSKKPKATYLFAGPPGVGKTFLAEQAAEMLALPFMRFDMSEYSERDALMELLGTNKSFKGDKEGGLTGFVAKNPKCVLLFDEIEKANIAVIHLFLQVLDAGRLRDTNTSKEVDFSQAIIIFTTNAGRKVYEGSLTPNLSGISRKTILRALETDIDPKTGLGSFPAAICSRFATGNVIMFNHMEAHSLRKIAEKEISRNAKCLEEETGIKCNVSDDVYSCVLFSEGGHADARTVKSRANSFFSTELYELFRLISSGDNVISIENIENIDVTLELPENEQVLRLFRDDSKGCILSFGDKEACDKIDVIAEKKGYNSINVSSLEEAKNIINKQDVELVFCDLHSGKRSDVCRELNIEDVDSEGRAFFKYVCESTDAPLYVLADDTHKYREEEKFSLTKEGVRGIVDVSATEELDAAVSEILMQLHHQQSMIDLAKSSKLITYETSQSITSDGKSAEIRLFDISLETAVDAEDSGNILTDVSKPNVKFDDIIGAESAKSELKYFVDYLKNPKTYSSKGLGVPKGVLFYGPPGTGKTMLAKAVAGESDVTFICASGNQFLKKYVGEGGDMVRNLFATARKYAPTIIFIDEIDAIAKERKGSGFSSESILTEFLNQMDGFKTDAKKPVFVLAATNFEVEPGTSKSLDAALLRRFDRHIYIDLPDKKARIAYINMKIKDKPIFNISGEEIENIAVRSTGMSLAQLASVFEFSMRIAIRENKNEVDDGVLEEAFESFIFGEEKKWDISELENTAYHEAGHAFLCWYNGETPSYLTVVARGNHGGYMFHGDTENRGTYTKAMLLNRIRTALGGRASELVFFGDENGLTTGPSSDLRNATAIAKNIVCNFGMDDNIGLAVVQENELSTGAMSQQIRDAINNILKTELENAKKILADNRKAVEKIVEELLQKNHLTTNEIDRIFSAYATKNI
ncbi:MAG: AAA family ATPase [Clostridia bacterium]|nr:AAA family ATPase [Clostridia bacterium]